MLDSASLYPDLDDRYFRSDVKVRKNVEVSIGSIKPPASNPADWSDAGIAGAWKFADGKTSTVILEMPLPLDMDRNEDVIVKIAWFSPSTTGKCKWQLQYLFRSDDEDMTASADGTITKAVSPSSSSNGLVITDFVIPASAIG